MTLFYGSADREGNSFLLDRQVGWSQKTTPVSSLDTSLLRGKTINDVGGNSGKCTFVDLNPYRLTGVS